MKKCPYCGAEYPDNFVVCPIDQTPFNRDSAPDNGGSGEEIRTVRIRLFGTHEAAALAASNLEAHGIKCWVDSDDCAGVYPNLTTAEGVSLRVLASDAEAADALLNQEATPEEVSQIEVDALSSPPPKGESLKKVAWGQILIGVFLGVIICLLYPWAGELGTKTYFHYGSDRKADGEWTYKNGIIVKYREDRNHDGKWDDWSYYDAHGELTRAEEDNNFDGKPDADFKYKNGDLVSFEKDTDFNGTPDEFCTYKNHIIKQMDMKPNGSNYSTVRQIYKNGVLTEEWRGGDSNGNFKVVVHYDPYNEPVSTNVFDLLRPSAP